MKKALILAALAWLAAVPAMAVRVPLADISDWAYRDERGVMIGHRTTRVLLPQMNAETRRSVEEFLGW